MKSIFTFILFVGCLSLSMAQTAVELTDLESGMQESSGLLFLNGKIITHNDSGGEPKLYEIDSLNGTISRTVHIENASNEDWEEITMNDDYIFIGEFGNNSGSRTNLKIYRLSILDYLNTPNDTVQVDTLTFNFADQVDFTPATFNTNFDAEAMIATDDSIFIFSKNWENNESNIYGFPNIPGDYAAPLLYNFDSGGLVCGASFHEASNKIVLCGYLGSEPFIVKLSGFTGTNFTSGLTQRTNLNLQGSVKIEGIAFFNENQLYLTSEDNFTGGPKLHRLDLNYSVGFKNEVKQEISIYPTPSQTVININGLEADDEIIIYDLSGKLIFKTEATQNTILIKTENYKPGMYIVTISGRSEVQSLKFTKL